MVKEYLRASVGTQVWGQDLVEGTRALSTLINDKCSHSFWQCLALFISETFRKCSVRFYQVEEERSLLTNRYHLSSSRSSFDFSRLISALVF